MKKRSITIPDHLDAALRARAEVEDRSVSWVVANALRSFLEEGLHAKASREAQRAAPVDPGVELDYGPSEFEKSFKLPKIAPRRRS